MAEQLKIIIEADVTKAVAGIQSLSKVITGDFSKAAQTASITAASLTKSIDVLKDQFQSIGKIKIDSTDLDKIQAKLNSLKVKDIQLGIDVVGSGDVNKAIDAIKAKFESLRLSPDLSVFNEIVAEINKLKSNEIVLHVDNSEALSALNKIESQFKDIKADVIISTNIDQDITRIQGKIAALKEIDIKADPSQAIIAIDKIISEITKIKDADVILTADNAQALKSINQLEGQLKDIRANVVINTTGFEQAKKNVLDVDKAFAESTARIDSLIDKMVADALGGAAAIKAGFQNILPTGSFKIDIDATAALGKISLLEKELADLKTLQISPNISTTQFDLFQKNIDQVKAKIAELKGSDVGAFVFKADNSQVIIALEQIKAKAESIKGTGIVINPPPIGPIIKSINELEQELAELSQRIDFSKDINEIRRLGEQFKKLQGQINNIKVAGGVGNQFDKLTDSIKKTNTSLNQLRPVSNSATQSMINLGRVVQDAPFGFLGIANNLNPLLEGFERLKAESGSTGKALKAMAGSLIGAGGLGFAVSIVSSLMITFGDRLFSSGKKAAAAAKETDGFGRVLEEVSASLAKDASRVTTLFEALTSGTLKLEERKSALKELASINNDFFGSLKEEGGLILGLQAAYDGYLKRLVEIGKAKAIQSQLTRLFDKKLQLELTIDPQFLASIDPRTQKRLQELRNQLQDLGGPIDTVKEKFGQLNATQLERLRIQQRINQLEAGGGIKFLPGVTEERRKEIERIDLAIQGLANSLQLFGEFDIKTPPLPDIKDETDKILERARQFVKEFGDTFVVPDLEETFFKGKKELLPLAQKLLDDVAKKTLQLKIPVDTELVQVKTTEEIFDKVLGEFKTVQKTITIRVPVVTELDFLPDNDALNAAKGAELAKSLTDNFLKGLQLEQNIPVDVIIDPSLSINNTKLIDEKLRLKKLFEDTFGKLGVKVFGTFNFDNLTKGIGEATKKFAEMKLVLDTLTQSVGQGLASAFDSVFDAVLEGKNVFKALGESVKALVVETIKAIAKMLILKAVTKILSGGLPIPLPGVAGGTANRFNLGGAVGGRSFQNTLQVVVTGKISGSTINLAGQRAANSNQRGG